MIKRNIIALGFVFLLAACAPEYGKGLRSSDEDYMKKFIAELNEGGISYVIAKDGMVRYKTNDEGAVREIHKKLRKTLARSNAVKYDEPEARDYFKSILKDKGLEFEEEQREDGIWIKWYPENDVQRDEIQMEVVKYMFDLKAQEK